VVEGSAGIYVSNDTQWVAKTAERKPGSYPSALAQVCHFGCALGCPRRSGRPCLIHRGAAALRTAGPRLLSGARPQDVRGARAPGDRPQGVGAAGRAGPNEKRV
jgi:hypothetical protein